MTLPFEQRARELFPVPPGVQPRVVVRLYGSVRVPSMAMRQQTISNTWDNAANRAIKRRVLFAHLMQAIVRDSNADSPVVYELVISQSEWSDGKRESLTAQVRRRGGEYAGFDNRTVACVVRFLTNVELPGSRAVDDCESTLVAALRDVDMPEVAERKSRVHLVWLSKGWALPAHEPRGTMKLIGYKKDVEPVDDFEEAAEAEKRGIDSWNGSDLMLGEWSRPRFFAVPKERVLEVGLEGALDDLLKLASALGYRLVRDAVGKVLGRPGEEDTAADR